MRLEQLYFFIEVSRSRSISLAASRLYMSQQNISTGIRKLETELGVVLFERTHHGVELTPIGEEVLAKAKEIVEKTDELKHISRNTEEQLTGELRVDMVPYIALPEVIVDFYRNNLKATVKTIERSPAEIISNIQNGFSDVGFIYLRNEEGLTGFDFEQRLLSKDQLYICVSKKLDIKKRSQGFDELLKKKVPLAVFNNLYDWTMKSLDQFKEHEPQVFRVDIQLYKKMILEGMAAGFATRSGIEQEIIFAKGEIDTIKIPNEYVDICMLYKKQTMTPLKERFLEAIIESFPQQDTL